MCTVVEAMFSYSTVFSIIGDPVFADKVEQMTFNALPATLTPDMWAHQYLQQSNEINSERQRDWWWNSDGGDSNLYGLAPNYGCCTANHPQGFPKFLTSAYMMTVSSTGSLGIIAALLGPSSLAVVLNDPVYKNNQVSIQQVTDYPFAINPTIAFTIQADHPFTFSFRVPSWAVGATLTDGNGRVTPVPNGTIYDYQYTGPASTTITLLLPTSFRIVRRYNNAVSVYYGGLLMALDISYNVTVLQRYAYNSQDLQYLPIDNWNYALQLNESDIQSSFTIKQMRIGQYPFDPLNPPLIASAYAREIDWPMRHSGADVPPMSPIRSANPLVPVTLIPYGATMLRIAEIPTLAN